MKATVTVNIASQAFTLDDDACRILQNYLNEIRRRLPEEDSETLGDIESRIAEIFCERVQSPMRVITIEVVRAAMNQIGSPAEFGEPHGTATDNTPASEPEAETYTPRKLYRSREDRSIAGVCGGIAELFGFDATLIRLVTLLLLFFGGLSIWVYIILWIVIPEAPERKFTLKNKKQ